MVAVTTGSDALQALAGDWRRLWLENAASSPFLAPEWLLPWWTVFGADARPVVATIRRPEGTLAALLPLYAGREGKLLPLGVGVSDQAGVLLAPDAPPDAAARLVAASLAAAGPEIARCDLPELAPGDPLLAVPPPPGWRAEYWRGAPCPVLALAPEPAIPAGMRRDLRQARNRAARRGGWSVALVGASELTPALAELGTLHGARWSERGETGVLADERVQRFHRLSAPALHEVGLLLLARLLIGGRLGAMVHALVDPGRVHFYLGGFDPGQRYESPGTLLIGAILEHAADAGRQEAHFLRGAERYKYAWGAIDRLNSGRSFVRA